MSDDLEIRGGGAIAVDTGTLRTTAGRFDQAGEELDAIRSRLGSLQLMLLVEREVAGDAASTASLLSQRLDEAVAAAQRIAERLRDGAVVYELVELNARHLAAFADGDREAMVLIDHRREALLAAHPDAMEQARGLEFERAVMWPGSLVRQATEAGHDLGGLFDGGEGPRRGGPLADELLGSVIGGVALGGVAIGGAVLTGVGGWGRLPRDARLAGRDPVVTVTATRHTTTTAPASLAAAAARVPSGGASQVRVEKYTMADGSRQFAVYVAGTRTLGVGGVDPWDSQSNVELYRGERSASYAATEAALRQAGAVPGDVVHAFGHSQGAMVTAHLALEGEYDTRTLVTLGSPVEADVATTTLSIGIRHTDDPVAALAGGGSMGSVGGEGSFIAERESHPDAGIDDLSLPAHQLSAYRATAELVDESGDPRVTGLRAVFDELAGAAEVEVTDYVAERGATSSPADEG